MAEVKEKKERRPPLTRRIYSDEERSNTLALLAALDGNVAATAFRMGIPYMTVHQWARGTRHPEATQASELKKETLAARLDQVVSLLVEGLDDPEKIAAAPLNVIATSLGIVIDKIRLLRGEAPPTAAGTPGATGTLSLVVRELLDPNTPKERIADAAIRSGARMPVDFVAGVQCKVSSVPVPAA